MARRAPYDGLLRMSASGPKNERCVAGSEDALACGPCGRGQSRSRAATGCRFRGTGAQSAGTRRRWGRRRRPSRSSPAPWREPRSADRVRRRSSLPLSGRPAPGASDGRSRAGRGLVAGRRRRCPRLAGPRHSVTWSCTHDAECRHLNASADILCHPGCPMDMSFSISRMSFSMAWMSASISSSGRGGT